MDTVKEQELKDIPLFKLLNLESVLPLKGGEERPSLDEISVVLDLVRQSEDFLTRLQCTITCLIRNNHSGAWLLISYLSSFCIPLPKPNF